MTEDDINELAREIAGDISRANGSAQVAGKTFNSSDMVNVIRGTLNVHLPRASTSSSSWAIDRLRTIATTAEPFDQICACEALVRCECAILEAAK